MSAEQLAPATDSRRFRCVLIAACLAFASLSAVAADPNPPSIHSDRGAWPICRQWTVAETQHFAAWIHHIYEVKTTGTYEQRTARLERVLTDPAINLLLTPEFAGEDCNEQLDLDTIRALHNVVDCAKLTVTLSTYYAYRRGLPWMFSYVRACDGGDVRTADYTLPGMLVASLDYSEAGKFFRDAVTGTCTGNFRVELNRAKSELSDTVPVAITPQYLLPGSMYYLDGHVLIVAGVTPHGEIRFLDATVAPSRDIYAYNGFNVVSGITGRNREAGERAYDGCFRGFRIHRWPVAETDEQGLVVRVRRRTDAEMKDFGMSAEQYEKIEALTATGRILEAGASLDSFHRFIRMRMRALERINLYADIEALADDMLALLWERDRRVQQAWRDVVENGPVMFPEDSHRANVYTAGGRWGELATAMDDVVLRARYFEFIDHLNHAIAWFDVRPQEVSLDGFNKHAIWSHADLADAVLHAKTQLFGRTVFEYTGAYGQSVPISLLELESRLYSLSFDPNHPPELRWGEPLESIDWKVVPVKGTPVPGGDVVSSADAYQREAYYRSMAYWEPEPSLLRNMFTGGFPIRDKMDACLVQKWFDGSSSPLVPHGGIVASLTRQ